MRIVNIILIIIIIIIIIRIYLIAINIIAYQSQFQQFLSSLILLVLLLVLALTERSRGITRNRECLEKHVSNYFMYKILILRHSWIIIQGLQGILDFILTVYLTGHMAPILGPATCHALRATSRSRLRGSLPEFTWWPTS